MSWPHSRSRHQSIPRNWNFLVFMLLIIGRCWERENYGNQLLKSLNMMFCWYICLCFQEICYSNHKRPGNIACVPSCSQNYTASWYINFNLLGMMRFKFSGKRLANNRTSSSFATKQNDKPREESWRWRICKASIELRENVFTSRSSDVLTTEVEGGWDNFMFFSLNR